MKVTGTCGTRRKSAREAAAHHAWDDQPQPTTVNLLIPPILDRSADNDLSQPCHTQQRVLRPTEALKTNAESAAIEKQCGCEL